MHLRSPFAAAGAVVVSAACLVGLTALPAMAAPASAPHSTSAIAPRGDIAPPAEFAPTAKVLQVDAAGSRAAVEVTGLVAGTKYIVNNKTNGAYNDQRTSANGTAQFWIGIDRNALNDLVLSALGTVGSDTWESDFAFQVDDVKTDLTAPVIKLTADAERGTTTLDVTGKPGSFFVLRNAPLQGIVGGQLSDDGKGTFTIPTPSAQTRYFGELRDGWYTSPKTDVVLNEGAGSETPAVPVIEGMSIGETRTAATVSGEVGAVTRVTTDDGTVVAVRAVGATGRVSMTVPTGSDYRVVQVRNGAASAPAMLDATR